MQMEEMYLYLITIMRKTNPSLIIFLVMIIGNRPTGAEERRLNAKIFGITLFPNHNYRDYRGREGLGFLGGQEHGSGRGGSITTSGDFMVCSEEVLGGARSFQILIQKRQQSCCVVYKQIFENR